MPAFSTHSPSEKSFEDAKAWTLVLAVTALAVPVGGVVLVVSVLAFLASATLPDVHQHAPNDTPVASVIYSADGEELARYFRQNRVPVSYEAIAPALIEALVATEDHRFYRHGGVDERRLVAALWHSLRGRRQGGSTLTMQLARNRYEEISNAPEVLRKVKEVLMARRIERAYTKQEILQIYLNTVPFGQQAYGVAAATHVYFDKTPAELDVAEAATLVGMLKGTTRYNPARNQERARERRNVVLSQMVKHGMLEEQAYRRLRETPIALRLQSTGLTHSLAPHFAEHVRRQVEAWAAEQGYDLYADGLHIYTTLDSRLQRRAQDAARDQLAQLQAVADYEWSRSGPGLLARDPAPYVRASNGGSSFAHLWQARPAVLEDAIRRTPRYRARLQSGQPPEDILRTLQADASFTDSLKTDLTHLQVGLVALDPQSGHVRAWVGGRDFSRDQYDHVAQARRQPGSTFKPFVYAAAIDRGYLPHDVFDGEQIRSPSTASAQMISLRDGLAFSHNTLAQHLSDDVGPNEVARMAERLGIRSRLRAVPSIALGTSEVTLLEMASAYGTLAARGTHRPPLLVTYIEDNQGQRLGTFDSPPEKVLSMYTSYTVLDMMRSVIDRGTGADLRRRFGVAGDLAGKTGTTQQNADGWFIMNHPHLVAGAWVGFNDRRIAFRTEYWGQGAHNALRVVGDFAYRAQADGLLRTDARFAPPPGYRMPDPVSHRSEGTAHPLPTDDTRWRGVTAPPESVHDSSSFEASDRYWQRDADAERALREATRSANPDSTAPRRP